jgi:hypothetical protein
VAGAQRTLGGEDAVVPFMGGLPQELPQAYAAASPHLLLPIGVPQLLVQGLADAITDLVDLNLQYLALAGDAGDTVELLELPEASHQDVIDPLLTHWSLVRQRMLAMLQPSKQTPRQEPDVAR